MPRKHRDVRSALTTKGFEINDQSHHIFFVYRHSDGRLTTAKTKLSHDAANADVSDGLLSQMAKQVGLQKQKFLELVDCPLSREAYERLVHGVTE